MEFVSLYFPAQHTVDEGHIQSAAHHVCQQVILPLLVTAGVEGKGGVSMSNEIMQENTPFVECSAFHRGMSVLEANLRNTEDSEAIISGLLKGAAEFYGASRECTNYFKCNFHPLHQATASLNCFHVISLQKRRSGTYRDCRKRDC